MDCEPSSFLPSQLRLIVIGAGISGIQFVQDAKTRLENISITAFDKNSDVGGTWIENKYPGWNPNPSWSQQYASSDEIQTYLSNTVDKFDLRQYFRFRKRCINAAWDEESSEWTVLIQDVDDGHILELHCDVFIYAVGRLNTWTLPCIKGMSRYQGDVFHTAAWPKDVILDGKRVAVIGNGASALQCISSICENSEQDVNRWRDEKKDYLEFRLSLEKQVLASFAGLWRGSSSDAFTRAAEKHMRQVFNPPTCPVNGSAYPGIERASDYMIRAITRLQMDNLRSICVKETAQAEFNRWVQSRMPSMVWSESCSSWYKAESGRVIVPWPGTTLHYYKATDIMRWEDFDLRFKDTSNKYSSFGNGITKEGFAPTTVPWLRG
ncbi:hypothetical protein PWT90_11112 [Aphanocladium album]|nr:hypothetical protein PWT90_11112 [Aphanocladium album]